MYRNSSWRYICIFTHPFHLFSKPHAEALLQHPNIKHLVIRIIELNTPSGGRC